MEGAIYAITNERKRNLQEVLIDELRVALGLVAKIGAVSDEVCSILRSINPMNSLIMGVRLFSRTTPQLFGTNF